MTLPVQAATPRTAWHRCGEIGSSVEATSRRNEGRRLTGRDDGRAAVDSRKVNARGFLHAGAIAAIADVAIGHALAATSNPPTRLVTVNLACDLLSSASLGDWVTGIITPIRTGRRVAAGTATLRAERVLATVTALFVPAGNQL